MRFPVSFCKQNKAQREKPLKNAGDFALFTQLWCTEGQETFPSPHNSWFLSICTKDLTSATLQPSQEYHRLPWPISMGKK